MTYRVIDSHLMTEPNVPDDPNADAARFRTNLVRVMSVQVITLILLWLLQSRYS
jgi:hypothetical protein